MQIALGPPGPSLRLSRACCLGDFSAPAPAPVLVPCFGPGIHSSGALGFSLRDLRMAFPDVRFMVPPWSWMGDPPDEPLDRLLWSNFFSC